MDYTLADYEFNGALNLPTLSGVLRMVATNGLEATLKDTWYAIDEAGFTSTPEHRNALSFIYHALVHACDEI